MVAKKFVLHLFPILLVLVLVLGMAGPAKADCVDALGCVTITSGNSIHIAYMLDLTGGGSIYGIDEKRAVEIAIDDAGGKILGHNILFDGQDVHCQDSVGGSAAAQLLDNDTTIVAIIGSSCSAEAIAAMQYLSAAGFSVVSPSNTNPTLTKSGHLNQYAGYLRTAWNDDLQGKLAAQLAYNELGITTAATIDNGNPYSEGLAAAFATEFITLGGTITGQVNTSDIDANLAILAAGSPELLYMPIFMPDAGYIIDNLPAGLVGATLMGSDGLWDPDINGAANEDGLMLTNYDFTANHNPDYISHFLPAHQAKYGFGPTGQFHAFAYDAFMIIKAAIESAAVDLGSGTHQIGRQALRTALYGTTNHAGLTGKLTCDANGDCAAPHMAVYAYSADEFPPEYFLPAKVGLVTDVNGVGDMGFNDNAYQGLLNAETTLGIAKSLYWPPTTGDYVDYLQQCVDDGSDLCIAVGFSMADAVKIAAAANPDTGFVILDITPELAPNNLRSAVFNEKQAGYLAGALAGKMTTSDVIGVVGGMKIAPVIKFAEGYRNGAQCANSSAKVLIDYTGTFINPDEGSASAQRMIARGADVIFGAGGMTGNGAILYSAQHAVWSIGVDTDQYLNVFENGNIAGHDKLLTSAMKRLDNAAYQSIQDFLAGGFSVPAGEVPYTLTNNGVGLAPYHDTDASIPTLTKDYVTTVKAGIIASTIDIDDPCRPTVGLVTDASGSGDMGYNYLAYQGILDAEFNQGINGILYEPVDPSEYAAYLQQCADDGNVLCIAVGFGMGADIKTVAAANAAKAFAILDATPASPPDNLRSILFNEKQAGYLAGALAGRMTINKKIGVVGGWPIAPVVAFAEGYNNGAKCADPNVGVLITYTNSFGDPNLGATTAQGMISNGADVIFGAAGATGNGAILYSSQHGVMSIGVDTDQYLNVFENGNVAGHEKLLTSAMKRLDNAVSLTIADQLAGGFISPAGTITYTLTDEGVGLAPYHDTDANIPAYTKEYVTSVKDAIIAGNINIDNPCIRISGMTGAPGVLLTYTDGVITKTATSDRNGYYSIVVTSGSVGTVTPSKIGYTFLPINRTYAASALSNQSSQNYAARTSTGFTSNPAHDGWMLEKSEYSNSAGSLNASGKLRAGDDAQNRQYRSLLFFDTSSVPDNAIISKVILRIYKSGFTGADPFTTHGNLVADIKKGFFGLSPLELGDFNAAAEPVSLGKFTGTSGWMQLTISSLNFKTINLFGATQFRIRFVLDDNNNNAANIALFDSGEDANPPQLIVEYTLP